MYITHYLSLSSPVHCKWLIHSPAFLLGLGGGGLGLLPGAGVPSVGPFSQFYKIGCFYRTVWGAPGARGAFGTGSWACWNNGFVWFLPTRDRVESGRVSSHSRCCFVGPGAVPWSCFGKPLGSSRLFGWPPGGLGWSVFHVEAGLRIVLLHQMCQLIWYIYYNQWPSYF